MKIIGYTGYLALLCCTFSLYNNNSAHAAKANQQLSYEKLPDEVRDAQLLTNGFKIFASVLNIFFGQALLDKENPHYVAQNKQKLLVNLTSILESLNNFIYALVRSKKIPPFSSSSTIV